MTILDADGMRRLATRQLDQRQFTPLAGAEGATSPFFSPNGQWLAFFSGGKLKKIPVQGGVAIALCDAATLSAGSWGDNGEIVAALGPLAGLWRVASENGSRTRLTELDLSKQEVAHRWPQVLPGSRAALFTSEIGAGLEHSNIEAVSLKTRERKTIVRGGSMGAYLLSGHLVYLHQNTLLAAPFNLEKLALTGPARPIVDDVSRASTGLVPGDFTFSETGTMVYISGKGEPRRSIFWLESSGKTQILHAAPGFYYALSFSPDGKRLAFAAPDEAHYGDIWVQDVDHDTEVRLTSMPGANDLPVWTPDGKFVVFRSALQSDSGYYIVRADGSSSPQRLMQSAGLVDFPFALSPDGKWLAIERSYPTSTVAIWIAPTEFDGAVPRLEKAELLLRRTGFHAPAFSPDGHWLAYASTETGTNEVYVQPFPGPGGKTPISIAGGQYPTWSHDGRLFFVGLDQRIMVADYTTKGGVFVSGKPRVWSEKRIVMALGNAPFPSFALAPDGKRFAVTLYTDGTAEHQPTVQLTFLLNFFDELRRRVPSGGK
jgi:serine/threonine-protein kinase